MRRAGNLQLLDEIEKLLRLERMDIHLPEPPFHAEEVDLVRRVGQMVARGGQTNPLEVLDDANVAVGVDGVRAR